MKHFFIFLLACFVLYSCDDGDIIVTSFDFDAIDLQECGDVGEYVFFKINNTNLETLSLRLRTPDSILHKEYNKTYPIDGSTNIVNYRTYKGEVPASYFCSSVPPASPLIKTDYLSSQGTVELISEITDTILPGGTQADTTYVLTSNIRLLNLRLESDTDTETMTYEVINLGSLENTID